MFTNKKRAGINTFVCAVFLFVAETPKTSIKDNEPLLPVPFGIVVRFCWTTFLETTVYILFNPVYVAARSLRSLRSNDN